MSLRAHCLEAIRSFLQNPTAECSAPSVSTEALEHLFGYCAPEGLRGLVATVHFDKLSRSAASLASGECLRSETFRNMQWLSELRRLDQAFTDLVPAIILKGGTLLHHGYEKTLGARFLSDIDLMVREVDLDKTVGLLTELGYKSYDSINFFHAEFNLALDLHTDPIKRVSTAFTFSLDELWSSSLPLDESNYQQLRRLGREEHYLQLAIHALNHGYERLAWIVDLAVIREDFDPELLWVKAKASHSERVVAYTYYLLQELFEIPTPAVFQEILPSLNFIERVYLKKVALRESPRTLGKLITIFSIRSWRLRAVYLREVASPQKRQSSWPERIQELWRMTREAVRAFWPKQ